MGRRKIYVEQMTGLKALLAGRKADCVVTERGFKESREAHPERDYGILVNPRGIGDALYAVLDGLPEEMKNPERVIGNNRAAEEARTYLTFEREIRKGIA